MNFLLEATLLATLHLAREVNTNCNTIRGRLLEHHNVMYFDVLRDVMPIVRVFNFRAAQKDGGNVSFHTYQVHR
jgi:hypothetical protein